MVSKCGRRQFASTTGSFSQGGPCFHCPVLPYSTPFSLMQTLNTLLPCAFAALAVAHSISVCQPSLVTDREVVSAYLSVGSRPEGDFTGRIGGLPISLSVDAEQHVQVTQSGIPLFAARL
ncbi:MAG: hypothetical protein MUE60_16270, partial [Candidatus Eisenbacteria bacterium]|nr:hypothetical protein [Candidatus Eisenbacteria bacterium]